MVPHIIAIDGPAGAGKSTVARQTALELDMNYVDTGATYRAVAWFALRENIGLQDEAALVSIAQRISIEPDLLEPTSRQSIRVAGVDATDALRRPEVSTATSIVSILPGLRRALVERQRRLARADSRGAVVEGRDIGAVVFPDADLKIYLTAGPEERARRRAAELRSLGLAADFASILAEQQERDLRDSTRAASPLVVAPDAHVLRTDGLSVREVVLQIAALYHAKREMGSELAMDR